MNKKQYLDNLLIDGKEYLDDAYQWDNEASFDEVYPEMELVITGNDNGSYYCNSRRAEEAVSDVLWDEDVVDSVRDLGYDGMPTHKGAEALDVIVRIALLPEILCELEEYWDELKEE